MNKQELEQLIDGEVSKVFSDMVSKEPLSKPPSTLEEDGEVETDVPSYPVQRQAKLTEDELDEILFYGGNKPKK